MPDDELNGKPPPLEAPESSAESLPAADVRAPEEATGPNVYSASFPVLQAPEDRDEVMVRIRGSTLRRVRNYLEDLNTDTADWSDLSLALFTLGGGAFLGSLVGAPTGFWEFVLRNLSPLVAVGAFVAFLFQRRHEGRSARRVASEALNELPDPDELVEENAKP